ncbi:MAG TPA: hypothetical protein VGY56_03035 [Verrucomicrobiae bacterium]|nr:hypothetical protein [Verrucomicrobiae bacterium]
MMLPKFVAPVLAGLFVLSVHSSNALAQGATAFTYQGHLLNNGVDANGTNGMIFTLYSAATGGTVIGIPGTNSVPVSNGLFTVGLDFGAGAFNGSACWLDIAVSNGVTNVELLPRAQVLPTPYATYAASAATAATAASATTAGTATNIVGGVVATGTFAGNGAALTNVPANLQMAVYPTPGSYTFTVPSNVWTIIVEAWGGGGGGGSGSATFGGGGGGGGAGGYTKIFYNVAPRANYQVIVGAGGAAGAAGGGSSFDGTILATGGSPGSSATSTLTVGGAGGSGYTSASTVTGTKGGIGKYGTTFGGGDGGSAGCGGPGGIGNLGDGGSTGDAPGGGGGGGYFSGTVTGFAGGNGEVIVRY